MFLFVCVLAFFACVSLRTRVCVCVGMSFIRCLGNGTESARHETSEQARAMDVKTQQAWLGVKNHHIVSNEGKDFAKKREDVKNIVRRIIGDPVTVERKSRWVCDFLSRDEVKRLLRLDPQAGYMSFSEVRSTLLSDKAEENDAGQDTLLFLSGHEGGWDRRIAVRNGCLALPKEVPGIRSWS
ncbi:unnamed protein product [Effrenium voratum]|nr:unnamed protein product [Effrenium voratum]CAJ1462051.1 unnamed protein product [Effrenium voratum]